MNPETQGQVSPQQNQLAMAQMQSQAQQGLGTPPPPPFQYKENPSTALMAANVGDQLEKRAADKEQQALAARAQADQATGGYAGRGTAQGTTDADHPNTGWSPSSPEAHNMNIQIANRIKDGSIDPHTAIIAMQSPDVSPEIKQALSVIVQQYQAGGSPQQQVPDQQGQGQQMAMSQQQSAGLGSPPLPQ